MKMKLFVFSVFLSVALLAQQKPAPTDVLVIRGKVKTEQRFSLSDLQAMPSRSIGDVMISNQLGEPKGTAKAMKGIPLSELLANTVLETDNPKLNSPYYFIFAASDGYKVVYSWNELLNNAVGANSYIVAEKEGKRIGDMEEMMLVVTPGDQKTGRRYIKGLSYVQVERVQ